jgi:hypothetical protein
VHLSPGESAKVIDVSESSITDTPTLLQPQLEEAGQFFPFGGPRATPSSQAGDILEFRMSQLDMAGARDLYATVEVVADPRSA